MKIKDILLITYLFFISQICISQSVISGQVIDAYTENPIFNAYISLNGKEITATDDEGVFSFKINNQINLDDKIEISHVAYGKTILKLSDIEALYVIKLKQNTVILDEVIIGSKDFIKANSILKSARKRYKNIYKKPGYWSEINLKQLVNYKDTTQNYLEVFGYMFMIDNNFKNPFRVPFIIPKEVRRTEDTDIIKKIFRRHINDFGILQPSVEAPFNTFNFGFRVFENLHPLTSKGQRNLDIKLKKEESINNKEYYVFEYKSKQNIKLQTRYFENIYGEFWLDKSDLTLFKDQISFDFETFSTINFSISYSEKENRLYPSHIKSNIHKYLKNSDKKLTFQFDLSFTNIDTVDRENRREIYSLGAMFLFDSFKYNKDFWSDHTLNSNPFKNEIYTLIKDKSLDSVFEKGANSEVNDTTHKAYKILYKTNKPNWELIKTTLKKDLNLK
ncbi:hypothetical protein H7F37_13650 [Winogradskyella sp. PAMC22761]|nr:hypothetical protein H7F37_13650 [Winogradskyella sp. PAMC22761]